MPLKFKGLTDRQHAIVETMRMRMPEKQALAYLHSEPIGFPISVATFCREKRKIKKLTFQRLSLRAQQGFQDQHIERIDNLELIHKLMWKEYHLCTSAYQRAQILKDIRDMQPYLSAYYDATRDVMEKSAQPSNTDNISISSTDSASNEPIPQ